MVFACLMLSVFATIDQYEKRATVILFYMVSSPPIELIYLTVRSVLQLRLRFSIPVHLATRSLT